MDKSEARNADVNPHAEADEDGPGFPVGENCCSFHYPPDAATAAESDKDAAYLRQVRAG